VKKLTSDSCSEHFLLLQFFDTLPGCRFTDCQFSVSRARTGVGSPNKLTPVPVQTLSYYTGKGTHH
jgi:hypothetical protein